MHRVPSLKPFRQQSCMVKQLTFVQPARLRPLNMETKPSESAAKSGRASVVSAREGRIFMAGASKGLKASARERRMKHRRITAD